MRNAYKSTSFEESEAKKHLQQIERYKLIIDAKCELLKELEKYSNLVGCNNIKSTYSNTNKISDKTENEAEKKIDLALMLKGEINKYTLLKNDIINDIYKTENSNYISILKKRYVDLLTLEQTSVEIGYTYEHTRHLHKKALKKLYEVIKDENN